MFAFFSDLRYNDKNQQKAGDRHEQTTTHQRYAI